MHVFGQYMIVYTAAKLPETVLHALPCSTKYVYKSTQGHFSQVLFIAHISVGTLVVVHWPNHSQGVDVEQGASLARGALAAAHAQQIACILAAMHTKGNGAVVPIWN